MAVPSSAHGVAVLTCALAGPAPAAAVAGLTVHIPHPSRTSVRSHPDPARRGASRASAERHRTPRHAQEPRAKDRSQARSSAVAESQRVMSWSHLSGPKNPAQVAAAAADSRA